jgi:LysM repeat protein
MFAKLLIVLVVAALAVGLVARSSHGAGPERTYVVKPTDTLWSIAAKSYGGDVREGVWKLEQRNQLGSATIRPGELLVLPG